MLIYKLSLSNIRMNLLSRVYFTIHMTDTLHKVLMIFKN